MSSNHCLKTKIFTKPSFTNRLCNYYNVEVMVDKKKALEMYERGDTLQVIGDRLGVSRQRINQIIRATVTPRRLSMSGRKIAPSKSELWLADLLATKGYVVTHMPQGAPYDLLLDTTIRIEVKHAAVSQVSVSRGRRPYFQFSRMYKRNFDFLIAITGSLVNPTCYIFPSEKCPTDTWIPESPRYNTRVQRVNREAWHLLYNLYNRS